MGGSYRFDAEAARERAKAHEAWLNSVGEELDRDRARAKGPRICVPGAVFSEAVQALLSPMVMAGPELHKRLQPRFERLFGIESAGLVARAERAALRWLLEKRETAPEATEDQPRPLSAGKPAVPARRRSRSG